MIILTDKINKFVSAFDPNTGFYVRSGVIENGKDTGADPFMTEFPNLLDIGIMGSKCRASISGKCTANCYQGTKSRAGKDMSLEFYKHIIDQSEGKVFQCALGGSGDPNHHENFKEILEYTRSKNIVPSYTTSGIDLTEEMVEITKKYCGAVAVSWAHDPSYRDKAIEMFLRAGVKTNIHYILGKSTIDEAIDRLDGLYETFPRGINAIIFLMSKPIGLGKDTEILDLNDAKLKRFMNLVDDGKFSFKLGFDACSVPLLLQMAKKIDRNSIGSCDASTYSAYITPDGFMMVCSMDVQNYNYAVDLNKFTMKEAWNSDIFESFRCKMINSCFACKDWSDCKGGCHLISKLTLCNRKERL